MAPGVQGCFHTSQEHAEIERIFARAFAGAL